MQLSNCGGLVSGRAFTGGKYRREVRMGRGNLLRGHGIVKGEGTMGS